MSYNSKPDKSGNSYFASVNEADKADSEYDTLLNGIFDSFYSEWQNADVVLKDNHQPKEKRTWNSETKHNEIKHNTSSKNIHKDHRKRVRNKFLQYGLDSFTDIEVLELLLYYSIPQRDTNELAHKLLDKFGSLKAVLNAEYYDLMEVNGISEVSASLIVLQREISKYVRTKEYDTVTLDTSLKAGRFCCKYFGSHVEESLIVIFLDYYDNIEDIVVISNGDETETGFYTRKVFKEVLRRRSVKITIAHNHPGDNPEPSANDISATQRLVAQLSEMGITLKDHIICAGERHVSLSDRGLLEKV
ncbi:MAG: hypothetical protein II998_04875 [Clostridia bacterium]|nr:hypothetical protein [Clostridia bacterium]